MKSSIFKYIFIIFVLGIIAFTIYMIYLKKDETPNVTNESEEVVEEDVKDLRLGISNFDTINPLISNNKEVLNIDKLIYEPILSINENYQLELCLAKECSKTSDTTYIIKIDNDKKWHDGSPLIAKDIQFTIDRLKEGNSIYSYNVEKIESVEIIDADAIKINLSEPVPYFEYNLTFPIVSNNYYLGENFYESNKTPIGTGMFKIESIDESNIILTKNDKWWNIKNKNSKVQRIQIKLYSEIGELYNTFKLGNIDIFTTSNLDMEQYIGTIGYTKTEVKGREFDYLAFNCENEVLKNVQVRKAIKAALDRANIVSSVYNNKYYLSDFPMDYGNYLYQEQSNVVEYNPEQAKQLLENDGWEYKYNRWQKVEGNKTLKLNLTLTVCKDDQNRLNVAEIIQEQLAQIGIKITINKVSDSTYQKILENKNYEMILTGIYNSYSPNLDTFFGENNLQNYYSKEMTTLLSEIKTVQNMNDLKEKYKKIVEIYNEEQPFISLYRNKILIIKNQNLSGEFVSNSYFSYYRIESWHRN